MGTISRFLTIGRTTSAACHREGGVFVSSARRGAGWAAMSGTDEGENARHR